MKDGILRYGVPEIISPFFYSQQTMETIKMETPEEKKAREEAEAEAKKEGKLPKGLLAATKQTILDSNGTLVGYKEAIDRSTKQAEKDTIKKSMERYLKVIDSLTEADIQIEKKENLKPSGIKYIVHAGNFGIRRVIMK
jgi:molecular chaperone GrpE (heat shock protein)